MFENLSEKLQESFRRLTGKGSLTEKNIEDSMRDVRMALLEADVNFNIVKQFIDEVRTECLGEKVMKSVTPGQQAIKIVNDHLARLMGEGSVALELTGSPAVIMVVGLHGGGKTTTTAKLARHLMAEGKKVLMAAADLYRPAAIDQLLTLGRENGIPTYGDKSSTDVFRIADEALNQARLQHADVVIVDTAGRLQVAEVLIDELVQLKKRLHPSEVLLVADAALGQQAVSVATHFDQALDISGIILTKLDGDMRGGAALSMRKVCGKPIKFVGVGEKITDLEIFYPDRMASRILGMGDVVSLVEKAAETISEEEAKKLEQKLLKNKFDFADFLNQLDQMKKLGGMRRILELIPGGKKMLGGADFDEQALKHAEAIVSSMTPCERSHPQVLSENSRRVRIARGSGRSLVQVQQFLKRFEMMRGMMSNLGKMPDLLGGGALPGGAVTGGALPGLSAFGGPSTNQRYRPMSQKQKKAKRKKHRKRR